MGLERSILLAHIKTNEADLNSAQCDYTPEDFEHLLSLARQSLKVNNIGFLYGKAFEPSCWGLLGHIVVAAKTLADALAYQKRYQCLLGNAGQAYHEFEGDIITIRWLSEPSASPCNIEQVITAWAAFSFTHTLVDDKPIAVYFTHNQMAALEDYETFFGCPVYFNANFNGIKVKESSLDLPLSSYNQEVLNVLLSNAQHKLTEKRLNASLDMITEYIIDVLPDHVPELAEISAHLGISTRQLQRKFQKESTNLTELMESIRKNLAISYLTQTDHKLLYISTMLGYSEQSTFQRAFKRWSSVTPQEFRLNPSPLI